MTRLGLGLLVVLIAGCNEQPVGYGELDRPGAPLAVTDVGADAGYCYGTAVAAGKSSYLFLGRTDTLEARVALQFGLTDSLVKELDSLALVLVRSPAGYDTTGRFTVYPLSETWNEYFATWFLAQSYVAWFHPGGDYDSVAITTAAFAAETTVVPIPLDQAARALGPDSKGLLLIPDSGGLASFAATGTNVPVMRLHFADRDSTLPPLQTSYFAFSTLAPDTAELWVGGGYALRSLLAFPLDSIPDDATVTSAELTLTPRDFAFRTDTVTLAVHRITRDWDGRFTAFADGTSGLAVLLRDDTTVLFDLRSLVQFWVSHPDSNHGLLLGLYPEYEVPGRASCAPPGTAGGPRLKVSYTRPPESRF